MKKLSVFVFFHLICTLSFWGQSTFYQAGIQAVKSGTVCSTQIDCDDGDPNSIDYCSPDGCINTYSTGQPIDRALAFWRNAAGNLAIDRHGGISIFDGLTYTNTSPNTSFSSVPNAGPYQSWVLGVDDLDRVFRIVYPSSGGQTLQRLNGPIWEDMINFNGVSFTYRLVSKNNEVWLIRYGTHYWHFDGTNWQFVDLNQQLPFNVDVTAIAVDAAGDVWLATKDGGTPGLIKYNGNQWQWIPFNGAPGTFPIMDLQIDSNGKCYLLAQSYGIYTYDNGTWTFENNQTTGLPISQIRSLQISANDQLWGAAVVAGLIHFDGTNWLQYDSNTPNFPGNWVSNIAAHPNHTGVYFCNSLFGASYYYFDGTNFSELTPGNSGPPQGRVNLAEAPNQSLWVYSSLNYYYPTHFDGTNWQTITEIEGYVQDLISTPSGSAWMLVHGDYDPNVGGYSSIRQWDGLVVNQFDHTNSILPQGLIAFIALSDTDVWASTYSGDIFHYDGSNWVDAQSSLSGLANSKIRAFHQTSMGTLYGMTGQHSGGNVTSLLKYVNNAWTLEAQLPYMGGVPQIHSQSDGTLWIEGSNGLLQYDAPNIQSFFYNAPPFTNFEVQSVAIDAQDNVLLGATSSTLFTWNGNNWNISSLTDFGIVADTAIEVQPFSNGSLWIYADGALGSIMVADTVWPGDADNDGIANNVDLIAVGQAFGSTGPARNNASLTWIGQAATPWASSLPNGTDYVHTDTDGSGTVNLDDTLAINLNYGLTHNKTSSFSQFGAPPLLIVPDFNSYMAGDTVEATIELGLDTLQADSVYGIAFSIFYDASLVEPNSIEVYYDNSWLGLKNQDLITLDKDMPDDGRIDLALSRTDQTEKSGYGEIARIRVVMIDDISGKDLIRDTLDLRIEEVHFLRLDGTQLPYDTELTQIEITQETTPIESPFAEQWRVYPNPARDILYLEASRSPKEPAKVQILNLEGRVVQQTELRTGNGQISLRDLPQGLYLLVVRTENGAYRQKIKIIH